MISISDLFCGCGESQRSSAAPLVYWELSGSWCVTDRSPLSRAEQLTVLDDLASFGVDRVRLAGIDPRSIDRLEPVLDRARSLGIQTTLETAGVAVDTAQLDALDRAGLDRLSVAVPGLSTPAADHEAGSAIDAALDTLERTTETSLATELRFPLDGTSVRDLEEVYDLAALLDVDRFRLGHATTSAPLSETLRKRAVRRLCDITRDAHDRGAHLETVVSGGDLEAAFLTTYAADRLPESDAEAIATTLRERRMDASGPPAAKIGPTGAVFPGPEWSTVTLGSLRDRPFGAIWTDETNPLVRRLRSPSTALPDRCIHCRFGDVCGGGSRGRAFEQTGDPFAPDPFCYVDPDPLLGDTHHESPAD